MTGTDSYVARNLAEAFDILAQHEVIPICGGTDLMVRHRRHGALPVQLGAPPLFVGSIPELRALDAGKDETSIGAAVTLSELEHHQDTAPGLGWILAEFASPAVRNAGTLGGNVCNASPAADTLPFLYVRNAICETVSKDESRSIPVGEFVSGPGATALKRNELLWRIVVPRTIPDYAYYRKVAPRRSNALSKLSVYAEATFHKPGGATGATVASLRIALGAVAPTVVRLTNVEDAVTGLTAAALADQAQRIGELCGNYVSPIDDQRSTAVYRANTARALVEHVLREIPDQMETL